MRYYVDPPNGADLNYGYANWVKKKESRGRVDGLLRALSRIKADGRAGEVGVVCWRGVMTR
jgi:RAT1-interacting protein